MTRNKFKYVGIWRGSIYIMNISIKFLISIYKNALKFSSNNFGPPNTGMVYYIMDKTQTLLVLFG